MAKKKAAKAKVEAKNPTKLPWTPDQIGEVEDKVAIIQAKLREMRTELKQSDLDAVMWKFGTFSWHVSMASSFLETLHGQLKDQIKIANEAAAKRSARNTREEIQNRGLGAS